MFYACMHACCDRRMNRPTPRHETCAQRTASKHEKHYAIFIYGYEHVLVLRMTFLTAWQTDSAMRACRSTLSAALSIVCVWLSFKLNFICLAFAAPAPRLLKQRAMLLLQLHLHFSRSLPAGHHTCCLFFFYYLIHRRQPQTERVLRVPQLLMCMRMLQTSCIVSSGFFSH